MCDVDVRRGKAPIQRHSALMRVRGHATARRIGAPCERKGGADVTRGYVNQTQCRARTETSAGLACPVSNVGTGRTGRSVQPIAMSVTGALVRSTRRGASVCDGGSGSGVWGGSAGAESITQQQEGESQQQPQEVGNSTIAHADARGVVLQFHAAIAPAGRTAWKAIRMRRSQRCIGGSSVPRGASALHARLQVYRRGGCRKQHAWGLLPDEVPCEPSEAPLARWKSGEGVACAADRPRSNPCGDDIGTMIGVSPEGLVPHCRQRHRIGEGRI